MLEWQLLILGELDITIGVEIYQNQVYASDLADSMLLGIDF